MVWKLVLHGLAQQEDHYCNCIPSFENGKQKSQSPLMLLLSEMLVLAEQDSSHTSLADFLQ